MPVNKEAAVTWSCFLNDGLIETLSFTAVLAIVTHFYPIVLLMWVKLETRWHPLVMVGSSLDRNRAPVD